jgi:hypothetical protein
VSIGVGLVRRVVEPATKEPKMQFLMLITIENNPDYEATKPIPEALNVAMGSLMEEWTKDGSFVSAAGLLPTSQATRIRLERGNVLVTDGPFTETKEVVGGFFLLEAPDRAAAVAMTRRFVDVHKGPMGDTFLLQCEVRQLVTG